MDELKADAMSRPATPLDGSDRFWAGVGTVLAPLLVWTAHFAFCYGWPLVACAVGMATRHVAGLSPAVAGLIVASAVSLGLLGWWAGRAALALAADRGLGGMVDATRFGASALALVATLWNVLAMGFVPVCG